MKLPHFSLLLVLASIFLISAGPNELTYHYSFYVDVYSSEAKERAISEYADLVTYEKMKAQNGRGDWAGRISLRSDYGNTLQLSFIDHDTLRFRYWSGSADTLNDVRLALRDLVSRVGINDSINFPFIGNRSASLTWVVAVGNFPRDKVGGLNKRLEQYRLANAVELLHSNTPLFTRDEVLFGKNSYSRGLFVDIEDLGNIRSMRGQIPVIEFRTPFLDDPYDSLRELTSVIWAANDPDYLLLDQYARNVTLWLKNDPKLTARLLPNEELLSASDEVINTRTFREKFEKLNYFYKSELAQSIAPIKERHQQFVNDARYQPLFSKVLGTKKMGCGELLLAIAKQ